MAIPHVSENPAYSSTAFACSMLARGFGFLDTICAVWFGWPVWFRHP
jgi:hypothetical protein